MSFILAVTIREYMKAARSPPRSEPTKSQDFGPKAMPRSACSACRLSGYRLGHEQAPSRYCRRQTISSERQMPCRRAVTEICRSPRWPPSTTRILSAWLQCRRRGALSADRISIWSENVRSTITSNLTSPPAHRQTAPAGGLRCRIRVWMYI